MVWRTLEGFSVQPYYRAEDLKDLKLIGSEAGVFPFVRGTKDDNTWLIRQDYVVKQNFKKANQLALDGMMKGVTAIGFDMSQTEKLTKADLKVLLKDFALNAVEINFKGCNDIALLKNFISIATESGVKPNSINASFDYDPLKQLNNSGLYKAKEATKLLVKAIELVKDFANIRVIGIYGYAFNDAGANICQELAYSMNMGSEYLNLLKEAKVDVNEAVKRMQLVEFTLWRLQNSVQQEFYGQTLQRRMVLKRAIVKLKSTP